ncbi:hypothetical protein N9K75_02200 [bacterium]|nr:hypothetical protein [bacterium]
MSETFEYWYGKIIDYESDPKKVTKLAWLHQETRINALLKSKKVLKEELQAEREKEEQ